MRRSPLKRKKPMRRSPVRKGRAKRTDDPDYLRRVRGLWCMASLFTAHVCGGQLEAHHATYGRGLGQKNRDRMAFCLCQQAHRDFHAGAHIFRGWNKERRRVWQEACVGATQVILHDGAVGYSDGGGI